MAEATTDLKQHWFCQNEAALELTENENVNH